MTRFDSLEPKVSAAPENPYRVKTVIAANGERVPMLLRRANGVPLFDPTVYALTQVRGRSLAAATVERHLRAIMHLELFAEIEGIDLEDRVRTGRLFSPYELDALVAAAGRPVERLVAQLSERQRPPPAPRPPPRPTRSSAPASLERYRGRLKPNPFQPVDADSAATRLRAIRNHVKWLAERQIGRLTDQQEIVSRREGLKAFIEGIDARMPSAGGKDPTDLPQGLSDQEMERLLAIIEPDAPDNPWADPKVRIRNRLMIHWLHKLGIRRGELLAVRIPDLNGRSQQVSIERRPDAADDPRARQPLVKTRGRDLPMSALFKDTEYYRLEVRRSVPGATKHPFLFVDMRTGRPLSHSALSKIFGELSAALGFSVAAHLLRHRWNDEFSARMDEKRVPEDTERKIRSRLQGWVEKSKTAANYTRRHVREAADKHMLEMQRRTFGKGATNEGK